MQAIFFVSRCGLRRTNQQTFWQASFRYRFKRLRARCSPCARYDVSLSPLFELSDKIFSVVTAKIFSQAN